MWRSSTQKMVACFVFFFCLVSFSSCGYFLYPERRGQTQGQVDIPVLLLDCAGLFIFIFPGVIALAVDFSSGAVYLPDKGKRSELETVYLDKEACSKKEYLESILSRYTGKDVHLDRDAMIAVSLDQKRDIKDTVCYLNKHINDYSVITKFIDDHRQGHASIDRADIFN
ncbi:MAG: hypothetical protein U9P49_00100 [Thermodesulfobacteriota bacterium]|nr:hypothetical protein [Thermodesulfobacteriota bacterium]